MILSHTVKDNMFRRCTLNSALFMLLVMALIFATLVGGALPAIKEFGLGFIVNTDWDPGRSIYGAGNALYGTLVSSLIAVALATPIGIVIAVSLSELMPKWLSQPISIAIELLSAIPSIIYGMWGLFVFAPWFANGPQAWMIEHMSDIPLIGPLFAGAPLGQGLFTAGLILAIMILPILTSLIKDALNTVPNVLKESCYGLGACTYEVILKVILPSIKSSVFGAFILALGRALGETMAVTFVIGNSQSVSSSLFMPATSISSTIANQFNEADGIKMSALMALGLVLFITTFLVMGYARVQFRKGRDNA